MTYELSMPVIDPLIHYFIPLRNTNSKREHPGVDVKVVKKKKQLREHELQWLAVSSLHHGYLQRSGLLSTGLMPWRCLPIASLRSSTERPIQSSLGCGHQQAALCLRVSLIITGVFVNPMPVGQAATGDRVPSNMNSCGL